MPFTQESIKKLSQRASMCDVCGKHERVFNRDNMGLCVDCNRKRMDSIVQHEERKEQTMNKSYQITFKWEITDDDLTRLWSPTWPKHGNDYCGHVFFGPFKVEFIWNDQVDPRNYINAFQLGIGSYGDICGVPYDQCDELQDSMSIPTRSDLEDFTRACEDDILEIIRANPYLIDLACQDADPNEWYQDKSYRVNVTHTHIRDL